MWRPGPAEPCDLCGGGTGWDERAGSSVDPPSSPAASLSSPCSPPCFMATTVSPIPLPRLGVPPVPRVPMSMAQAFPAGRAGTGGTGPGTGRGRGGTGGTGWDTGTATFFRNLSVLVLPSRAMLELYRGCLIVVPIHRLAVVGMGAGSRALCLCRGCGLGRLAFPTPGVSCSGQVASRSRQCICRHSGREYP
jgi:hypothetical protein